MIFVGALLLVPAAFFGAGAAPLACTSTNPTGGPVDASPDAECAPGCLSCNDALVRQEGVQAVDVGSLCNDGASRFYWDAYRACVCQDCAPSCNPPEGCAADTGKVSGVCLACTKASCAVQRAKCAADPSHDGGC